MWIESHQSLLNHRKTGRISRALSISKITAIGHLHAFWWWCLDNAPEGDITGIDAEDIAQGAFWEGDAKQFLEALKFAEFVDADENSVLVHDWQDYAGKLIDRRVANRDRMREARDAKKRERDAQKLARAEQMQSSLTNVQGTCDAHGQHVQNCVGLPNLTVPNLTEQEREGAGSDEAGLDDAGIDATAPSHPQGKSRRGSRISADWQPSPEALVKMEAKYPEIDMPEAIEAFVNHWLSQASNATKLNWEFTWFNDLQRKRDLKSCLKVNRTITPPSSAAPPASVPVPDYRDERAVKDWLNNQRFDGQMSRLERIKAQQPPIVNGRSLPMFQNFAKVPYPGYPMDRLREEGKEVWHIPGPGGFEDELVKFRPGIDRLPSYLTGQEQADEDDAPLTEASIYQIPVTVGADTSPRITASRLPRLPSGASITRDPKGTYLQ